MVCTHIEVTNDVRNYRSTERKKKGDMVPFSFSLAATWILTLRFPVVAVWHPVDVEVSFLGSVTC
jgi:hypothetical protein